MRICIYASVFAFFLISYVFALEIPISGALPRDKKTSSGIVSVDMEAVFDAHPKTSIYKYEITNFANTRKNAIETKIKEYEEINALGAEIAQKINEAKSRENQDENPQDIAALSKQYEGIKADLTAKKRDIEDLSKRTKREISLMEENNSLTVLKEIEEAVREVAGKYGGEVAIDKQNLLFSSENAKDITGEVIIKLREKK
ncbi:MAG: OmpH family outer membrane protein [Endomicrobium sp.]|jgi:Skp family chaperone for outer membrane proteins|nr:OmpH family outer membrane protein [Endomicrobium sp.]